MTTAERKRRQKYNQLFQIFNPPHRIQQTEQSQLMTQST